jgi:hypothetical protein
VPAKKKKKASPKVKATTLGTKKKAAAKKNASQKAPPPGVGATTSAPKQPPKLSGENTSFEDVPVAELASVEGTEFQELVWSLVGWECAHRFAGVTTVSGGGKKYTADGGEDSAVVLTADNVAGQTAPDGEWLLSASAGTHCISAKTGDWKKLLVRDVKKGPKTKDEPFAIKALASGGDLLCVINEPAPLEEKRDVAKKIVDALRAWGKELGESADARVRVKDANDVRSFLRQHRPPLSKAIRRRLRLVEPHGTSGVEAWAIEQRISKRPLVQLVGDPDRIAEIRRITEFANGAGEFAAQPILWVQGQPGVGKSRLVLEALMRVEQHEGRVFILSFPANSDRALGDAVKLYGEPLLVIDECSPSDASRVAQRLAALNHEYDSKARLICIGPRPEYGASETPGNATILDLRPLRDSEMIELVERELGLLHQRDPRIALRIRELAEGHPWFALLLVDATREAADASTGDVAALIMAKCLATEFTAANAVLAGVGSDPAWKQRLDERKGTVGALAVGEQLDWNAATLPPGLAHAFGVAQPARLVSVAQDLLARGLVRTVDGWRKRYVTPEALVRIVLTELIPSPLGVGERLRELKLIDRLFRVATRSGVRPEVLAGLGAAELGELTTQTTGPPLDALLSSTVSLRLLARSNPERAAGVLRAAIEATPIEALRVDRAHRRELVWALQAILHRKGDVFRDAEAALFRLALAENEKYANNATAVWMSTFHVFLHLTHSSWSTRFAILRARVERHSAEERALVHGALGSILQRHDVGMAHSDDDLVDGQWPNPSRPEALDQYRDAWRLLMREIEARGDDFGSLLDVTVSAFGYIVGWLRAEALSDLARLSDALSPAQRVRLLDALERAQRFYGKAFDDAGLATLARELAEKLGPRTLHEKLVASIGRWPNYRAEELSADLLLPEEGDLAREALKRLDVLEAELPWLDSPAAVRAQQFMVEVGRHDVELLFKPALERFAAAKPPQGVNLLTAYVMGARKNWADLVDVTLRQWRTEPRLAVASFVLVWKAGPTSERIRFMVEDLTSARVPASAVSYLAFGRWARQDSDAVVPLVQFLVSQDDAVSNIAALTLGVDMIRADAKYGERLRLGLIEAYKRLIGSDLDQIARQALLDADAWLEESGEGQLVFETALRRVTADGAEFRHYEHEWHRIHTWLEGHPEQLPQLLDVLLDEQRGYGFQLDVWRRGTLDGLNVDAVLQWIGGASERAYAVANAVSVDEAPLPALPRRLLQKFGPDSEVAGTLSARAHSTSEATFSLVDWMESQLAAAERWAKDPDASVAEWGRRVAEAFREDVRREEVRLEVRRREEGF